MCAFECGVNAEALVSVVAGDDTDFGQFCVTDIVPPLNLNRRLTVIWRSPHRRRTNGPFLVVFNDRRPL